MMYTNHTAGMSLGTALDIMEHRPTAGWTPDQQARARAVIAHWARIRRNQTKGK
jgi:hypothetical protein